MIEKKTHEMNSYFTRQIAACEQRAKALAEDDRSDEAVFEKVKANVYDAFRSVLSAAVKVCKNDAGAVQRFFEGKLDQIPSNWVSAYDKAKQHNDAARMQVEQIKIDAANEIREVFMKIWGESE